MRLGLHLHKITTSKELVDTFNDLSLSISYDKVLEIETAIANSAVKEKTRYIYDLMLSIDLDYQTGL